MGETCSNASRSVLDLSWFGLRPVPCVKGSYLRLDFKGPAPSLTQAQHEKFRKQHTRLNSKPCTKGCHLQLASQQKLCIKIHMLTVISVHTEISAPKKRPEIWSFPLLLRRINLRTTTRNSVLVQHAQPHGLNIVYESSHERMTYN